jgi:hypothetical protein
MTPRRAGAGPALLHDMREFMRHALAARKPDRSARSQHDIRPVSVGVGRNASDAAAPNRGARTELKSRPKRGSNSAAPWDQSSPPPAGTRPAGTWDGGGWPTRLSAEPAGFLFLLLAFGTERSTGVTTGAPADRRAETAAAEARGAAPQHRVGDSIGFQFVPVTRLGNPGGGGQMLPGRIRWPGWNRASRRRGGRNRRGLACVSELHSTILGCYL